MNCKKQTKLLSCSEMSLMDEIEAGLNDVKKVCSGEVPRKSLKVILRNYPISQSTRKAFQSPRPRFHRWEFRV
jgi:hypothetical protein